MTTDCIVAMSSCENSVQVQREGCTVVARKADEYEYRMYLINHEIRTPTA